MWSNVKKEVKKQVDDEAAARGKANRSKGNKDSRTKRVSTILRITIKLNLNYWLAVQCASQVSYWIGQMRKISVQLRRRNASYPT